MPSECNVVPGQNPVRAVTVAMLTYRRPDCLARILPMLVEQAASIDPVAGVVVVDNDPAGGAAEAVGEWRERGITYVHEPRPGIAVARNRALDEAAGAAAVVFIDDDELPSADWLAQLVARWQAWDCAAVTGPVVAAFEAAVDPWVRASGVFDRRVRRTGDTVAGAATNNLLLDVAAVRGLRLRFDESLGLVGGEDTMFSHQLLHRGGQIRWCDEAEVIEPVPEHRATRGWVLRRTFRAGTSWSRMELELAGSRPRRVRTRLELLARGLARLVVGVLQVAWGTVGRSLTHRARGTCTVVSQAGMLAGAFGVAYREYGRPTPG